jgi:SNF2 family DNA or RNA helicase
MGTGKTLPTLRYIEEFMTPGKTVLVVSQKYVAGVSWVEEIKKWTELEYINIVGKNKAYREKHLQRRLGKIVLASFGTLKPLGENYRSWDLVVVDEASLVKDTKTLRHRCLKHMKFGQTILLTGTPTPNGWHEIWGLMVLLGKQKLLGDTKSDFLMNYFFPIKKGHIVFNYKPLNRSVAGRIKDKIKDFCLVADKPRIPSKYIDIPIELSKSSMKIYKQLENDLAMEIEDSFILASNKAVLINKLRQLTSGNIFDIESKSHFIHDEKLEVFKEFLEKADENILVWYAFTESREAIKYTCETMGVSYTTNDVEGWNRDLYRVFIGHPQSFGYGMNMQEGSRIILWYDLVFSSSQYEQANARIVRKGQKSDCLIYHLICRDTVDEKVKLCLDRKKTDQDFFLEQFKE